MTKIIVVIPTYNESKNLRPLIKELEEVIKEDFEIIFVDDSSPDGTADLARKLNEDYKNIKVHQRPSKLGIGSAIVDGLKVALKERDPELIITMDADFSHDPKEITRLLKAAREGADLVQGSRYIPGGKIVGWNKTRYMMSYLANLVCRIFLRTGMKENTTYFRAYSKRFAQDLIKDVPRLGFEFSIGSILLAKDTQLKVVEVPITFTERAHGKSKLRTKDIFLWWAYVLGTFFKRL